MDRDELRAALRATNARLAGHAVEPVALPLPAGWVWVETAQGRRARRVDTAATTA